MITTGASLELRLPIVLVGPMQTCPALSIRILSCVDPEPSGVVKNWSLPGWSSVSWSPSAVQRINARSWLPPPSLPPNLIPPILLLSEIDVSSLSSLINPPPVCDTCNFWLLSPPERSLS